MCSAITIVHTTACTSMDRIVKMSCNIVFLSSDIVTQYSQSWSSVQCDFAVKYCPALKCLASLHSGHELEIKGLVMKCFYACTRDLHWMCNFSCSEIVHWTSSCTCARLVHQLCNSCAVDTPRWCSRHRSASTRRDQGRRRESRFRCETTVVAHWASASAASLSRGTRSSSSTQSLLRNDATGISFCRQF